MIGAASSTDTQKSEGKKITGHMSCVTCHWSPVTNTNSHRHRPSPMLSSPLIHSRLFIKTKIIVLRIQAIYPKIFLKKIINANSNSKQYSFVLQF